MKGQLAKSTLPLYFAFSGDDDDVEFVYLQAQSGTATLHGAGNVKAAVADGQSDGLTVALGAVGVEVLGHLEADWWSGWCGEGR